MSTPLDRAFLASDAFDRWTEFVGKATDSITVLAPRLDATLSKVLEHARIDKQSIIVLTTLRPDAGFPRYREHLEGILLLLSDGVEVQATSRPLAATSVIRDWCQVSIGSQLLTAQSRSADNLGIFPGNDISGSDFESTLEAWLAESTVISKELIAVLLERLELEILEVDSAHQHLSDEFDAVIRHFDYPRPARDWTIVLDDEPIDEDAPDTSVPVVRESPLPPISQRLGETLADRDLAARKEIPARLQWTDHGYESLFVEHRDDDLTQWTLPTGDGGSSRVALAPYRIYPIILNPSGRMAFARVTKSRITYIRQAVAWADEFLINGLRHSVIVRFPKENFETANMHLEIGRSSAATAGFELRLRFDGTRAVLSSSALLQDGGHEESSLLRSMLLQQSLKTLSTDPTALQDLLHEVLNPFRYSVLHREDHNAADFFPRSQVHLTLFRFGQRWVLAATDTGRHPIH